MVTHTKANFSADWKNWIKTNIDSGQNKDGIFKILLDEGYSYDAIVDEINYTPSMPFEQLINPFEQEKKQAQESQIHYGTAIPKGKLFIANGEQFQSDKIELYTLQEFLTESECKNIIAAIKSKLRPSELSSHENDKSYRTSQTCDLEYLDDGFSNSLDVRVCKLLGVDPSYAEPIQGQYYEIGQEFKEHTDYFEAHEIEVHGRNMGQRTYTCMIYLNDLEEGGETHFTRVGAQFKPKRGMAVIWNSLNPDGSINIDSMHQALPVLKGYKAVITKWFRGDSVLPQSPPMFTKEANEYIQAYTKQGFKKFTLPQELFSNIESFYEQNKAKTEVEHVAGDFIVSHKHKKSSSLIDLSSQLKSDIHDVMKPLMEKWCGKTLEPTYVYGIRIYHSGAILKTHRDRLETHIISAILNVDQEVDQDWPLLIEDNYYRQHGVLLKPGEMIFYEGARLTHGRPKALKGTSFANIFCHFRPTDYVPRLVI
ncbi:MAG: 2OG-Fe(II) oxygenase [Arenicella sp.]|nr:2OG-Fe(II) oxygenase [Arenicella sp.]